MFIRDLQNNEYFIDGVVSHDQELNGDERIDIDIHYTDNNAEFLSKQDDLKMWTIIFENKEYVIISSKMSGKGNQYTISVTAILYVLDWLNSNRIYQRIDASLTTTEAFNLVFDNSPFTYITVNSASSERFEGLGDGETRLEVFKTLIDRYGYEMNIVGNVVYLQSQVGNDTNFEYRYKVNASNITKETNAADLWTYVKGYADYDDNEEDAESKAKIKRDYVSPLESVIGGRRHAPPVKDGRIKYASVLDKKMKEVVDNSVQISFSADINDMSQHGYDYQHAVVGDRVFLVDERIGLNTEIRVVQISRTINANDELRSMEITFGTQPISDTYSANFNNAVSSINDLLSGRRALPFAALDIVSRAMVSKIQATTSELVFDSNGIHAIDTKNNNNIMTMNSSGLMISTDGGRTAKTAITAEGINADAITTGTLIAQSMHSIDKNTIISIENGYMTMLKNNGSKLELGISGLNMVNSLGTQLFSMNSLLVTSAALGTSTSNVYLAAKPGYEARVVDVSQIPSDGAWDSYTYLPLRADSFIGNKIITNGGTNLYLGSDDEVRVTARGGYNGLDTVYRNVRALGFYGNFIDSNFVTEGQHIYIRPDAGSEVRFTKRGTTDRWVDIRGKIGWLSSISSRDFDSHFYIGTDQEVRITGRSLYNGGSPIYRDIRASAFYGKINPDSSEKYKTNITKWDVNATKMLRDTTFYEYDYKADLEKGDTQKSHGVIIEREMPQHFTRNNDSVDLYEIVSTVGKALQEQIKRNDELENKLDLLEAQING